MHYPACIQPRTPLVGLLQGVRFRSACQKKHNIPYSVNRTKWPIHPTDTANMFFRQTQTMPFTNKPQHQYDLDTTIHPSATLHISAASQNLIPTNGRPETNRNHTLQNNLFHQCPIPRWVLVVRLPIIADRYHHLQNTHDEPNRTELFYKCNSNDDDTETNESYDHTCLHPSSVSSNHSPETQSLNQNRRHAAQNFVPPMAHSSLLYAWSPYLTFARLQLYDVIKLGRTKKNASSTAVEVGQAAVAQ